MTQSAKLGLARELAVVLGHFFPELTVWLGDIRDPRQSGRAVFPMKVLLLLGVLMFLAHTGSRNHFNDNVRDALEMAKTMARLLGCDLKALPHLDTLEKVLRLVNPDALEVLLAKLIRRLIRMKALDDWRVGGRFLLAIDGTGLYSFRNRHCEHCIEAHHDSGAVTYSHKVLVAFIVSDNGYALPIACEFVENPLEHVYSHNPVAFKGYFMLMLTAHIVQQLITRGRLGTVFKSAFHTFLHYGKQMLEALKNQYLPPDLDPPGQIRLSTA